MKVVVTHLKAPWPAGAAIGSVVEVAGDTLPGCLVGKCKPADDDAKASHAYEPQLPVQVISETALAGPDGDAGADEEIARLTALLTAEREATEELAGRLHAVQEQLDAARAELEALKAATKTGKGKA